MPALRIAGATVLFLLAIPSVYTQNLLPNPGFESGTLSWHALWTRETNVATAGIVRAPVHSGDSALRIDFRGRQDWSFMSSALLSVRSGDVYETRAWARGSRVRSSAEFSVILYDSSKAVLSWSWGAARIDTSLAFRETRCRFLIPEGVAFIAPRFIGVDSCDIVVDDAAVLRIDSAAIPREWTLNGPGLRVDFSVPSFALTLTATNRSPFRTRALSAFQVSRVDSSADSLSVSVLALEDMLPLRIVLRVRDGALAMQLHADSSAAYTHPLAFPGSVRSAAGDRVILPRAEGLQVPVSEISAFGEYAMYGYKSTMSFIGMTGAGEGYMLASDDPWSSTVRFETSQGDTLAAPLLYHLDAKSVFGHDRTFFLVPVGSGGYNDMCAWYRAHAVTRGLVRPFAVKRLSNPNIDKLLGAVDFWALGAWMQTPAFIDTLVRSGIDRAIVSLGGGWWNQQDHSAIIDTINRRGLLSSRYDIYTDVWPPTHPEWPWYRTEGYPGDVIVDKFGALQKGWLAFVNDTIPWQGYVACSATHRGYAEKWISADLAVNRYTCRFIDVELAAMLSECYSPAHPVTRREDAAARVALLDLVKNRFALVTGSEEARDFAFPVADFGEGTMSIYPPDNAGYDWSTPVDTPGKQFAKFDVNPLYRVPLHALVYHDTHVATWYTGDGMSKVPSAWDDKDLFNVLYASMPLVMPPSQSYWQSNRERFLTSCQLTSAVFRSCGFARMLRHEFVGGDPMTQRSEFESGWSVLVNFSADARPDLGLPGKGFLATDSRDTVGRMLYAGDTIAFVKLRDRYFLNPYGMLKARDGVRSSEPVFLRLDADSSFHLALLGSQEFAELQPWNFPFHVRPQSIRVTVEDTAVTVPLQYLPDGWMRFSKVGKRVFYRIEGTSFTAADAPPRASSISLAVSPNPILRAADIHFALPTEGCYAIDLFDILGRHIATLASGERNNGSSWFHWDASKLARGTYRITLRGAAGSRSIPCLLQ